jgi:hypothetical protein
VRLYDSNGTILAETIVTNKDLSDGLAPNTGIGPQTFNVHSIIPVTLAANTTYVVASDVPDFNTSGLYYLAGLQGISTNPSITYGHGVETAGGGKLPLADLMLGVFGDGYLGPNVGIEPNSVPEPTSLVVRQSSIDG